MDHVRVPASPSRTRPPASPSFSSFDAVPPLGPFVAPTTRRQPTGAPSRHSTKRSFARRGAAVGLVAGSAFAPSSAKQAVALAAARTSAMPRRLRGRSAGFRFERIIIDVAAFGFGGPFGPRGRGALLEAEP